MKNTTVLLLNSKEFVQKVFLFLVSFIIVFFLGDLLFNWNQLLGEGEIRLLFNITREDSLATTFSSLQAIIAGLIGLLCALSFKLQNQKKRALGWKIMGFFFIYLGVDDAAQVHERFGTAVKSFLIMSPIFQDNLSNYISYSWHLIFGGFFGSMAIFILFFLWKEFPSKKMRLMYLAALSCFVLAVGMDFIEGIMGLHNKLADNFQIEASSVRHFSKVTEECIEMFGTTLFLISFLKHYISQSSEFVVRFSKPN